MAAPCPICQHAKREAIDTVLRGLGEKLPRTLPATLARKGIHVAMPDLQAHQAHMSSASPAIPEPDRYAQRSTSRQLGDEPQAVGHVDSNVEPTFASRSGSPSVRVKRTLRSIETDIADAHDDPDELQRIYQQLVDFVNSQLQEEQMGL